MMPLEKNGICLESIVSRNLDKTKGGSKTIINGIKIALPPSYKTNPELSYNFPWEENILGKKYPDNSFSPADSNLRSLNDLKKTNKRRKRLHNECSRSFFCSVPLCRFSSEDRHKFEEHYKSCNADPKIHKTKQGISCFSQEHGDMTNVYNPRICVEVQDQIWNENPTNSRKEGITPVKTCINSTLAATPCNGTLCNGTKTRSKEMGIESEIKEESTSNTVGVRSIDRKVRCRKCTKTFLHRKQLARLILSCSSPKTKRQMKDLLGKFQDIHRQEHFFNENICRFCSKMYKDKLGLKKHMDKRHYKTTSIWNGEYFVPTVQISLLGRKKNKQTEEKCDQNIIQPNDGDKLKIISSHRVVAEIPSLYDLAHCALSAYHKVRTEKEVQENALSPQECDTKLRDEKAVNFGVDFSNPQSGKWKFSSNSSKSIYNDRKLPKNGHKSRASKCYKNNLSAKKSHNFNNSTYPDDFRDQNAKQIFNEFTEDRNINIQQLDNYTTDDIQIIEDTRNSTYSPISSTNLPKHDMELGSLTSEKETEDFAKSVRFADNHRNVGFDNQPRRRISDEPRITPHSDPKTHCAGVSQEDIIQSCNLSKIPKILIPPKSRTSQPLSYGRYLKKISKNTVALILNIKARSGLNSTQNQTSKLLKIMHRRYQQQHKIGKEDTKAEIVGNHLHNDFDFEEHQGYGNIEETNFAPIDAMHSLSLGHRKRIKLESNEPNFLESRNWYQQNNDEIQFYLFRYQTVMKEILRNEAKVIFNKVTIHI